MFTLELLDDATRLIDEFKSQSLRLATAESCTGGLVAGLLTEIAGASDVLERGFITYSNPAKSSLLGVDPGLIARHGAVSAEVARAMAEGALARSEVDVAIAVTGIAGPGGATPLKPVGLVHLAAVRRNGPYLHKECRFGDIGRSSIRIASVREALGLIRAIIAPKAG